MSYEIPRELVYEEKVMFNLSLWQAACLGIGLAASLAVFFRTNLPFEAKAALSIAIVGIGMGFAFFNFKEHALSALKFLAMPQRIGYFDRGMAEFIELKGITSDAVILKDGSAKSILHVQPINFHILSDQHKAAVISAYRDFLNSIDFPIQIAMRTASLSMEGYFDKMDAVASRMKNAKVYSRFMEYRKFAEDYIMQKGAKNRFFYIVVPSEKKFSGNVAEDKQIFDSLFARTKLCQEKLGNCGLFTKRLCTEELAALFSSYFDSLADLKADYLCSITSEAKKT